jgi:hypothetical protein
MKSDPYFLIPLWIEFALCGYVFLLTSRIDRKFGSPGIVTVPVVVAVIGPIKDYWYLARFPKWGIMHKVLRPCLGLTCRRKTPPVIIEKLRREKELRNEKSKAYGGADYRRAEAGGGRPDGERGCARDRG